MKNNIHLIIIALLIANSIHGQLQTHDRTILFGGSNSNDELHIEPNTGFEKQVSFSQRNYPVRRVLRVVGGIELPRKFSSRGETFFREQEYLIDDNLDSLNVLKESYSLYFKGNNYPYEQHAFNRITGVDFSSGNLDLEIAHKRRNLYTENGDFGIELQLYYNNERRYPDDIYDKADSVIFIPIPQGSGDFEVLKSSIKIPTNTITILLRIGGTNFEGECWLESPKLALAASNKNTFHSPFVRHVDRADSYNYWVGINMATRSWPLWKLEFEGKKFSKEMFLTDGEQLYQDFCLIITIKDPSNKHLIYNEVTQLLDLRNFIHNDIQLRDNIQTQVRV